MASRFPDAYRARYPAEDAADDIVRLEGLAETDERVDPALSACRATGRAAAPQDLPPRRAGAAVRRRAGAREFRLPRARGDADPARGRAPATSTNSCCRWRPGRRSSARCSSADADRGGDRRVLEGEPRTTMFNQLIVLGRPEPARGGAAARLVPLSAPDRPVLFDRDRGRRAAPRARRRPAA